VTQGHSTRYAEKGDTSKQYIAIETSCFFFKYAVQMTDTTSVTPVAKS